MRDLHRQAAVSDSTESCVPPSNTTYEIAPPPMVRYLNAAYKQLLLQQGSDLRAAPINLRRSPRRRPDALQRFTLIHQHSSAALASAHSGVSAPPHPSTSLPSPLK